MSLSTAALASLAAAPACLDPLVDDMVRRPELILPAGSEPDDPPAAVTAQIEANDGLDGDLIEARTGFQNGVPVRYWDFGEASPVAIPLYLLVEESEAGMFEADGKRWSPRPEAHPIFDKVPGDPGYSPWWTVVLVPVTAAYDGEVLASFDAVEEARKAGLVGSPMVLPVAINCPVVTEDTRLARTPGEPAEEPSTAYYHGYEVYYVSFGMAPVVEGSVAVADAWQLRREGGEPLSEPIRGVDMTGDGDRLDTNDVFLLGPSDAGYSGMVRLSEVVVAADLTCVDTSGSDAVSDITSAADLYSSTGSTLVPNPATVVAVLPGSRVLNRPIAPPADPPPAR